MPENNDDNSFSPEFPGSSDTDLSKQTDKGERGRAGPQVPVVGVGASAGGLKALEELFSNLPSGSGIAFVVISHTDPSQPSMLPDILQRKTNARVTLIEDGMKPEPDVIYFTPSNMHPVVAGGVLHLIARERTEKLHLPVDIFLKSLSEDLGELSGCVILSGTGTDGTQGLRAVKENGGVTVAQSLDSAQYSGMPESAVDTGLVDFVMAPAEIPAKLIRYFRSDRLQRTGVEEDIRESLSKILFILSRRTKHDFTLYKKSTLLRRIARRMRVTGCRNGAEYLSYLHRNLQETEPLFNDLLIGVTSFFRDPEAFAYLQKEVLPGLILRLPAGEAFRVWIPGCATGEEAYSISIIINEVMTDPDLKRDVQIFATDIDRHAIEKAREGVFLQNISTDVSSERLKQFFVRQDQFYRVDKKIREPVVFAEQNVLGNPPFTRLDLLVCRNLLIYLEGEAQKKLFPLFHYTLKPEGVLFLGLSESIGRFSDLFSTVHKKWCIFRKQDAGSASRIEFPVWGMETAEKIRQSPGTENEQPVPSKLGRVIDNLLLKKHMPPCVVVNRSKAVLYFRGQTGRYLEPPEGEASYQITDMAREGLGLPLSAALHMVFKSGREVKRQNISVKTNGGLQKINFSVTPLHDPPALKDTFLIVFETAAPPEKPEDETGTERMKDAAERGVPLELELARVQENYRSALEDLETSNEELKSINEEFQSANEELQSSNEELESSQEELRSTNEELFTVNAELHSKIDEVSNAYKTITDVLTNTHLAILFLDKKMRVIRFTDEMTQLMNLIQSDIGRPIHHITLNFECNDLTQHLQKSLETCDNYQDEIRTNDGTWYDMRIIPYRTHKDTTEGVVLTFVNINALKAGQARIRALECRGIKE